ncbi:MAG TPA: pectate lyase [Pirellulales bacterium]
MYRLAFRSVFVLTAVVVGGFCAHVPPAHAQVAAKDTAAGDQKAPTVIDTAGFRDGAHHWRNIRDTSRMIQAVPDQPAYRPEQIDEIVANILLFQRDNGGWPKDYDMLAILTPDQAEVVGSTHDRDDTSFDNHNIHSQVEYLAQAYAACGKREWRAACLRGLDFMLASQLSCGGFPQRYPKPTGYSAHITFNDGVMIGILNVLQDASEGLPAWSDLDQSRRQRSQEAVERGIECILKCQIVVDGQRTGWCQQHDAETLAAASARTFELASICPQETTEIARFLMRAETPGDDVEQAVTDAVKWLDKVRLVETRVEKVKAPVENFLRHDADFDVVVRHDPTAPPIWARHYEIGTDRPVFAGRDAVKRYALAEIERERRTGTPWYGGWPRALLAKEYPRWREKRGAGPQANAPQ